MDFRDTPVSKIVEDLLAGAGDVPTMEKYQISPKELMQIKGSANLLHSGRSEVSLPSKETPEKDQRLLRRHEMLYRIEVHDADNPALVSQLNNVHAKGLQIEGAVTVTMDEVKTLMVNSEAYEVATPVRLQAECRWSMVNEYGLCVAGLQITNISNNDARELRKLIDALTAGPAL